MAVRAQPHPTPTPTLSSILQFCFCSPRRPQRAAANPSLSPTWGSLAISGPGAPKTIPPPLPPAPHFPAIWLRPSPPNRGGGHPIPLLSVFVPRHVSPGHPRLEVHMVLSGPPGQGGTWLVETNHPGRHPSASTSSPAQSGSPPSRGICCNHWMPVCPFEPRQRASPHTVLGFPLSEEGRDWRRPSHHPSSHLSCWPRGV